MRLEFYLLPAQESSDFCLLVYSAKEYINAFKTEKVSLGEYLTERISKREHGLKDVSKVVKCLWIPMVRFPHKYREREEVFYHTTRVLDLAPLKVDVLLGERL